MEGRECEKFGLDLAVSPLWSSSERELVSISVVWGDHTPPTGEFVFTAVRRADAATVLPGHFRFAGARDTVVVCGPHTAAVGVGTGLTPGDAYVLGVAIARACRFTIDVPSATVVLPRTAFPAAAGDSELVDAVAQLSTGLQAGLHRFDHYKATHGTPPAIRSFTLALPAGFPASAGAAAAAARPVSAAIWLARDCAMEPANVAHPENLSRAFAAAAARAGATCSILSDAECRAAGMTALCAVASGSRYGARLCVVTHTGVAGRGLDVALVGKGVTMDTGGYVVKAYPSGNIHNMKLDMCGAAVCASVVIAAAAARLPVNVAAVLPLAENAIDERAYRPGDIVRTAAGLSVEVHNTDAEGRVVLCDALWYAQHKLGAPAVVDLATLTGAQIIALGPEFAAGFSNAAGADLMRRVAAAGVAVDEKVWELPLHARYDRAVDSAVADMRNVGEYGVAGCIAGAQYLARFIKAETAWVHVDAAGPILDDKSGASPGSYNTAWGVRMLSRVVASFAKPAE